MTHKRATEIRRMLYTIGRQRVAESDDTYPSICGGLTWSWFMAVPSRLGTAVFGEPATPEEATRAREGHARFSRLMEKPTTRS